MNLKLFIAVHNHREAAPTLAAPTLAAPTLAAPTAVSVRIPNRPDLWLGPDLGLGGAQGLGYGYG